MIQKVNHLLPALPKPSEEVIGSFENDLSVFLWKSKIHQVNKNIIYKILLKLKKIIIARKST